MPRYGWPLHGLGCSSQAIFVKPIVAKLGCMVILMVCAQVLRDTVVNANAQGESRRCAGRDSKFFVETPPRTSRSSVWTSLRRGTEREADAAVRKMMQKNAEYFGKSSAARACYKIQTSDAASVAEYYDCRSRSNISRNIWHKQMPLGSAAVLIKVLAGAMLWFLFEGVVQSLIWLIQILLSWLVPSEDQEDLTDSDSDLDSIYSPYRSREGSLEFEGRCLEPQAWQGRKYRPRVRQGRDLGPQGRREQLEPQAWQESRDGGHYEAEHNGPSPASLDTSEMHSSNSTGSSCSSFNPYDYEESIDDYGPGGFHPVRVDEVYNSRYLVLRKLGWGGYSTVWLVRDLHEDRFRSMKILRASYTNQCDISSEVDILKHLGTANPEHEGFPYICHLIDDFWHKGPNGTHMCLIFEPMGQSLRDTFTTRFTDRGYGGMPLPIIRSLTRQLLLAVSYAHEYGVIHTGKQEVCDGAGAGTDG